MKVLFHLIGGQQGELLLNLIFPDYPDGHGDDGDNAQKMPENKKETDKAVSNFDVNAECTYTSRLVEMRGFVANIVCVITERKCLHFKAECQPGYRGSRCRATAR